MISQDPYTGARTQAAAQLQPPVSYEEDTPEGAANMRMVAAAVQNLHAAFDSKFIFPKSLS